jgi:hypothetical protein
MRNARWSCLPTISFVMAITLGCSSRSKEPVSLDEESPPGREESLPGKSIYHADPQHLWNRLHEAVFHRIGLDGKTYGQDRLEPLLWTYSKHLLEERSRDRVLALLDEFLRTDGEALIADPRKRAMLQRDLWMVFNWLETGHPDSADPKLTPEAVHLSRERLRRPLAAVIERLALSPKKIESLPDNYAEAVASGRFARNFDPEQPDKPYLPPDLFVADGPWVCVGVPTGPVAPQHLREDGGNSFTNSAFFVLLRLPAGRAATVDFLKRLRAFEKPLLVRASADPKQGFVPNPALPQFPKGTEVALVRRALLIDSARRVEATPLTESIQLRVMRAETPALSPQDFQSFMDSPEAQRRIGAIQSFHEFRLSRAALFAGRAGGLSAVGPDDRDFKTGFNAHPWDEFEQDFGADRTFEQTSRPVAFKELCFACHGLPGVYSFNSFFNYRIDMRKDTTARPFALSAVPIAEAEARAVQWKESRPNWKALRGLMAE